jgi:AcrR family transcriptional regulator
MSNGALDERARLLRAIIDTVALCGYAGASVEAVSARAGVAPEAFLGRWPDLEACFLAAFEELLRQAFVPMLVAAGEAEGWEAQVAAATRAALTWCERNPLAARAILFESAAVSTRVAWRLSRALDHLAGLIHAGGCAAAGGGVAPSPAVARALVRKAHAVLHDAIGSARGAEPCLTALAPALASTIVLQYTGERQACRELARGRRG